MKNLALIFLSLMLITTPLITQAKTKVLPKKIVKKKKSSKSHFSPYDRGHIVQHAQ